MPDWWDMRRPILDFEEDDYVKALADLADRVYDRDWLLDHTEGIERLITAALARPQHFEMTFSILGRLSVYFLNSAQAARWYYIFEAALRYTWDNGLLLESRAHLSLILAGYFNMLGAPELAATLSQDVPRYTIDPDLVLEAYTLLLETTLYSPTDGDARLIEAATKSAEATDSDALRLMLYVVMARRCMQDEERQSAQMYLLRAQDILKANPVGVGMYSAFRLHLAWSEMYRRSWEYGEAEEALVRASGAMQHIATMRHAPSQWFSERGALDVARAAHDAALESLTEAIDTHPGGPQSAPIAPLRLLLARVHLNCDRLDDAAREAESAHAIWTRVQPTNPLLLGDTLYAQAQIAARQLGEESDVVQQMYCAAYAQVAQARASAARTALLADIASHILQAENGERPC